MRLDGEEGVLQHYLIDVDNRLGDLTLLSYTQRLGVLVQLLRDLCGVTELEQVAVLHLRKCVQYLLTTPVDYEHHRGRNPEYGEVISPSTVKAYIRVWKAFFNWCYQEELIDSNPAGPRFKPPKVAKRIRPAFSAEHIDRMLAVCNTSTADGFRDQVILLLLLDTGMRIAEISALCVSDVHDRYIKVMGKGRKEREIGIFPEVSKMLWKYIHKYRKPDDPSEPALFIARGKPLRSSGVHYTIKYIQKECGLEDIKFSAHVFRHTFAKMYLDRGGDLFKLSREMGHSDVNITKMYLEDFGSTEARKDHDSFSPLVGIQIKKRGKRKPANDG